MGKNQNGLHPPIPTNTILANLCRRMSADVIMSTLDALNEFVVSGSRFFMISGFVLILGFAAIANAKAAESVGIEIIPIPVELRSTGGRFTLRETTRIVVLSHGQEANRVAEYVADRLNRPTGYKLSVSAGSDAGDMHGAIRLILNPENDAILGKEGYRLSVEPLVVNICANEAAGLFYGVQTMMQLLPSQIESSKEVNGVDWTVPCTEITDYPRFRWRGLLLDVSRHFFSKDEIKRYIDQMAKHKLNTFQWHLTDDHGWRIEIKKYPKLTEIGAGSWWGPIPLPSNRFYSQEDIREVVAYAKERFVTIVPDIDVPGHCMAALASYPELSCTGDPQKVNPNTRFYGQAENTLCLSNEKVYEFLDSVFDEVSGLFPGQYIHMGGDEAFTGFWEKCPKCQDFKRQQELENEQELKSYFIKRVEKIVNAKDKGLVGWDEILGGAVQFIWSPTEVKVRLIEGKSELLPNATIMSWLGLYTGGVAAAKTGRSIVMSPQPYYYLDLYQGDPIAEPPTYGMNRLNTCYGLDPVPDGIDVDLVLGVQGNVWTEAVEDFGHVQYMTWPRGMAIAETAWSPKARKNWPGFAHRVEQQFDRMDAAGVDYSRCLFDPVFKARYDPDGKLVIELSTELEGLDIFYTFSKADPDHCCPKYDKPLVPGDATELRVITYREGKAISKQINMPIAELERRAKK